VNIAPAMTDLATTTCIICTLLVPFAGIGLALINCGLGRSRNAAHSFVASLFAMASAAAAYFVCGFSWQSVAGNRAHTIRLGSSSWNWLGAEPLFLRGIDFGSSAGLVAWLGMLCAALAALIPLGSGGERWRLKGICLSSALMGGLTYPLFAHWAWGGGWLSALGTDHGLGRGFVDVGGAATIQCVGGFSALAITWILGSRRGKFHKDGMPAAIPGHNSVFILFGCLLAMIGWIGLNASGAIVFAGVGVDRIPQIAINTFLSAGAATLSAAVLTGVRFGKPDASLAANGWVGGLVAASAGCAFLVPLAAVIIGASAGLIVATSIELLELRLKIDDPGGSISVHASAAIWGLLTVGLFQLPNSTGSGQWVAQLVGVATLIGFVLPLTYGFNLLANRLVPYRVSLEGERQGMDLHELGSNAYPELANHLEDFYPR